MDTSDGIRHCDWVEIESLAEAIVDASSSGADDKILVNNLISKLRNLEKRYGRLPSILATEADYVENDVEQVKLLKEAYVSSCETNDVKNKSFVSASLAEFYTEKDINPEKAKYWLDQLKVNLHSHSDSYLESVYDDVSDIISQAKEL